MASSASLLVGIDALRCGRGAAAGAVRRLAVRRLRDRRGADARRRLHLERSGRPETGRSCRSNQKQTVAVGTSDVRQAVAWMVAQALAALCILLTFDGLAILLGFLSLVPVAVYPFAKRFTWWPQVFLGIAFNWGALLAWAAHSGTLGPPAYLLYLSGICWTLFYDTIYAYQDIDDDALIGIKSTARLFGDHPFPWLSAFAVGSVALMSAAVLVAVPQVFTVKGVFAIAGTALFGIHLLLQLKSLEVSDGAVCLRLFRSNRNAGLIPAAFFLAAAAI